MLLKNTLFILLISLTYPNLGKAQSWMTGFSYRKKITIDKSKVTAKTVVYSSSNIVHYDLVDFPVLVEITDKDLVFKDGACGSRIQNAEGRDISFALATAPTIPLNFQIDGYNPLTGKLTCWVKISSLSADKTTTPATAIYFYHGGTVLHNPKSATALQTWNETYSKVWNMGSVYPEAGIHQLTSGPGTNPIFTNGKFNKAIAFNGQSDFYKGGLVNHDAITISAWVKIKALGADQMIVTNDSTLVGGFQLKINAAGKLVFQTFSSRSQPIILTGAQTIATNGEWNHIVVTLTAGIMTMFLNNLPAGTSANTTLRVSPGGIVIVGASKQNTQHFNGEIDDIKIQSTLTPSEWLNTTYTNQSNPSGFLILSAEEYNSVGFSRFTGSNGQWNLPSNWTGNVVPPINSNILIPSGKKIVFNGTGIFNKLVLEQGATIDLTGALNFGCSVNIESGGSIKVNDQSSITFEGQVRNNGQINAIGSTSKISFSGNYPTQEYSGNGLMIVANLDNNQANRENSLHLNSRIEVSRFLNLKKGFLYANLNLVFLASSQSLSAALLPIDPLVAAIYGDVVVQQYISGNYPSPSTARGWRLLSSPVYHSNESQNESYHLQAFKEAIFVTGSAGVTKGFDPSPQNGGTIYTHDQSLPGTLSQKYVAIKNMSQQVDIGKGIYVFSRGSRLEQNAYTTQIQSQPFVNPKPYLIKHTGRLFSGNLSIPLTNSDLGNAGDGFNLIGNPYASPIKWGLISTENTSRYIWQFDPLNNAYLVDDADDAIIPTGTGFFVRMSAGKKTGMITFTEQAKSVDAIPALPVLQSLKTSGSPPLKGIGSLRVSLSKDDFIQRYVIKFNEQGFDGINDQDAPKIGDGYVSIYSMVDGQKIAIEERSLLIESKVINLSVWGFETGSYQLDFNLLYNNGKIKTTLVDHHLNSKREMTNENSTYSFVIDKNTPGSYGDTRFSLLLDLKNEEVILERGFQVFPNPFNDQISFLPASGTSEPLELTIVDMVGRILIQRQLEPGNYQVPINTQNLSKGVYLLTVVNKKTKKRIATCKLLKI